MNFRDLGLPATLDAKIYHNSVRTHLIVAVAN